MTPEHLVDAICATVFEVPSIVSQYYDKALVILAALAIVIAADTYIRETG